MTESRRFSAIELFSGYDRQRRPLRGTQYTVAAVNICVRAVWRRWHLACAFQSCNPSLLNDTE